MTTPTTMIRWTVMKELVDQLRVLMPSVDWHYGWPGEKNVTAQMAYIGNVDGDMNVPVMAGDGNPVEREDTFSIPFEISVRGLDDLDATTEALMDMAGVLETLLATSPALAEVDGVDDAVGQACQHSVGLTPAGYVGHLQYVVVVTSRLA